MIYITSNKKSVKIEGREVVLTEDMILSFCHEKNIAYIYFGG